MRSRLALVIVAALLTIGVVALSAVDLLADGSRLRAIKEEFARR